MSAIEMQSLLARLYIDDYCRQLFYLSPKLVLDDYRLTEAEKEALVNIDTDRLDYHLLTLVGKHQKRLRRYFPLLYAINDATETREIERLFRRFHSLHPATVEAGPEVEVQLFSPFIRQSLAGIENFPPYAGDIARYEAICFHISRHGSVGGYATSSTLSGEIKINDIFSITPHTCVETFDYNVADLAAQLREHTLPTDIEKQTTTMAFRNRDGKLKTLAVSGPTAMLLRTLDGRRTVQEAVDSVEQAFGTPGLHESIVEVMYQLEEKGIITRVHA